MFTRKAQSNIISARIRRDPANRNGVSISFSRGCTACFVTWSRKSSIAASYWREVPLGSGESEGLWLEPADPAPGQLDLLIRKELESIVVDCLPRLDRDYRTVLKMRANGLKYDEIATRLGVNENTVATWVSRGIRALAEKVRDRSRLTGGRS